MVGLVLVNVFLEFIKPGCKINAFYNSVPISSTLSIFIYLVFFFVSILLFLIDIVAYSKIHGFTFEGYFIHDDPFRFRIEFYLVFLLISASLSSKSLFSMFLFLQTDYSKQRDLRNLFSGGYFFSFEIMVLLIPWYSILVSIKRKIVKHWTIIESVKTELEFCLKNEKLNEEFKKFATTEWSVENVYFIEDLNNFKKSISQLEIKRMSRNLLETYIMEDAPLEVNIPREVRKEIIQSIQKSEMKIDLFQKVENEVFLNLQDTFDRFKMTPQYEKLIKRSPRVSIERKPARVKSLSLPPTLSKPPSVITGENLLSIEVPLKDRKRSRSVMGNSEKFAFEEFLKTISIEVMLQLDNEPETPEQSEISNVSIEDLEENQQISQVEIIVQIEK
jgi:hypothetical protein